METSGIQIHQLRILVAIASYGTKNLKFLKRIIQAYRAMPFNVHLIVFSESPKELGADVENIVGLPSKNPWTLPFAHKPIFADRLNHYDLFVYSEDDIGVTEAHIRAFLRITPQLETDEIAGFVRYEVDASGKWFVNEPWKHYHWKPESVRRRGECTIAEFTNEHTGLYILTQAQLKRAIVSGGFLRGPCRGRYDWPETAATDPYTNCGFRKVICVSAMREFLVHHMPNPYLDKLDVSLEEFEQQIQTLTAIRDGHHPASTLCEVESKLMPTHGQKSYYEVPSKELLRAVPSDAQNILSIGCGWGATEARLLKRGASVTALPLDSVIGAVAERRGVRVIYGSVEESFRNLNGQKFDCVLMTNLLHLQENPGLLIDHCGQLIRDGGTLVLAGPNFDRAPWLIRRALRMGDYGKLRSYKTSGFSLVGPKNLPSSLERSGFRVTSVDWLNHSFQRGWLSGVRVQLRSLTARDWVLQAQRVPRFTRPSSPGDAPLSPLLHARSSKAGKERN